MDLAVIIVNYNTKKLLGRALAAVFASQTDFHFAVWVVDNCSEDRSAEMVKAEFPQVRLIENKENLGFAKANNLVLRQIIHHSSQPPLTHSTSPGPALRGGASSLGVRREAGGELPRYVLLLNSDVVVSPETFEKMVAFMDNSPSVGISGCKVLKPDGTLDLACRRSFPKPLNAFYRLSGLAFLFPRSRFASYNLTYLPEGEMMEVDSLMGAFMLIRRSVVEKIGLLDEDFFMYGEDLDYCFRAKASGFKIIYLPITTVVHYKGSSSQRETSLALYEFHRAMQIFYDKYYRRQYSFLVNFLVKFGIWLRYVMKLLQNTFRQEKYVSK